MTTTTFKNAKAVKWNLVDGKEVWLNRQRLWPAPAHELQLPNSYDTNTGIVVEAIVGDTIKVHPAGGAGSLNWLDAILAIFEVQGGNKVNPAIGPASGTYTASVAMPDGTSGNAFVVNSRVEGVVDTHGMKPGTYVIMAGAFNDFSYDAGVMMTIHLKEPLVPGELRIQLPDNPFDPNWKLQTYQVVRGQDVVLIPPKNPLPINDDSNHPTWRHIVYIGWNPRTDEAIDFLRGNEVQSNGQLGSQYQYTYINNGTRSTNQPTAESNDMNAIYGPAANVPIRLHMSDRINPGFWIIPVNGNYNSSQYDLNNDGLYYLELVSKLPANYDYNPTYTP